MGRHKNLQSLKSFPSCVSWLSRGQYPKQMLSACLHSEFPPVHCQWVTAVGTGLNLVELERQAVYFFFTKRALTLWHVISVQVRYFWKWLHGIMSSLIWFPPTSICWGSALVIEETLVCLPVRANWHWIVVKESTAFIAGTKQGEWAAHAQRPRLLNGFQGMICF